MNFTTPATFPFPKGPTGQWGWRRDPRDVYPGEIALLTDTYYPIVGGGERHAHQLAADLRSRGWDVRIYSRQMDPRHPGEELHDGIPVTRIGPSGSGRVRKRRFAQALFRRLAARSPRPALLLVCGMRTLGIPATAWGAREGIPVALRAEACGEFSGAYLWRHRGGVERLALQTLLHFPLARRRYSLRRADRFLALAGLLREEFEAGGVDPARIVTLPNGIDLDRFRPLGNGEDRREARQRHGLPPDAFLLVYSGKLIKGKGLSLLLEAVARARIPELHLLLLGSGEGMVLDCEKTLRERASRADLAGRVTFSGYQERVEQWLPLGDLFVFPSESEAFGLAPLEAAACGLPLLSSHAGALGEILRDGDTARLLAAENPAAWAAALEELHHSPEERCQLAERAHAMVHSRYSRPAVTRRYEELFASLLPPRASRPLSSSS